MRRTITTLIARAVIRSTGTHTPPSRQPRTAVPAPNALDSCAISLSRTLNTSAASNMSSASTSATSASASASAAAAPSAKPSSSHSEPKLPPLSAYEFKEYNRLAEHMDAFHNHFRSSWNLLYTSASSGRRAQGLSIRAFVNTGLEFISHLELHHSIEERYIFPELARRMPEFRTGRERNLPDAASRSSRREGAKEEKDDDDDEGKRKKAAELLQQHVEIHKGMDGLREYLQRCLSGETELQMGTLKAQLDTWGTVLWTHLDQEVRTLGAENMRRYWSVDEMRKLRM
ncbi:hypothetical protein F5Y12DRAFT_756794 [Xylaria sp. FL1777]|nr:hypothetical protein F5Y12DRAFT_756794 [Xylaria sp. FL1777]